MSGNNKTFRCPECGGTVRMLAPSGETREYARGLSAPIPSDILIPKCDGCGEVYLSASEGARIDAALRDARLHWQTTTVAAWLDGLKRVANITLREIEEACHVTPTYLSHVANGTKLASGTVIKLLEMYVRHPEDLVEQYSASSFLRGPAAATESFGGALGTAKAVWGHASVHSRASAEIARDPLLRMQA